MFDYTFRMLMMTQRQSRDARSHVMIVVVVVALADPSLALPLTWREPGEQAQPAPELWRLSAQNKLVPEGSLPWARRWRRGRAEESSVPFCQMGRGQHDFHLDAQNTLNAWE